MAKGILFDANNLAMRCLFAKGVIKTDENGKAILDEDGFCIVDFEFWRYILFNSIMSTLYVVKDAKEVVLARDSGSWRKIIYPNYKANRVKSRDEDNMNWPVVYAQMDEYWEELKSVMPFKQIKVEKTEADDVIGILCLAMPDKYVVISTDKDYLQLSRVAKIYHPIKREYVSHPNPERFLQEQCLMGQRKDNIINIMTPLDVELGTKWKPFGEKGAEKIIDAGLDKWLDENDKRKHYELNRRLLDFKLIPTTISKFVVNVYERYQLPPIEFYPFFEKHGWPQYLEEYDRVERRLIELY